MNAAPASTAPASSRRAVLLFAMLVIAVWADPLFARRNFTGRDLLPYNLPMEKTIHDAYASRRLPIWSPDISGGRPLLPNPNAGALYPVRPLLSLLSFPAAMRVYPVLHWIAAGAGVLLLLGELGLSPGAAWVGAVTYVFSGVSVSDVFFPHIQPGMTLLPWIVWSVARRGISPAARAIWLGALFGLDLLAADVFTVGLALGSGALWLAVETDRRDQVREFGILSAGFALGVLAAAPQIVATALWIPETNRAVLGMRLAEVTLFSISPWRLLEFAVPYPFGRSWNLAPREIWGWVSNAKALGLFVTLYAGALAPIAVAAAWRERRPGVKFARLSLVIGLALSVVPSLLPRSWGSARSPLPLRNPEKLAVAVVLAIAIFAARGYEVYRRRKPGPVLLGAGAAFAAAALACALWPLPSARAATALVGVGRGTVPVAAAQLAGLLAVGGILWIATVVALELARRPGRAGAAVSLILLTAVPVAATRPIPEISAENEAFAPTPFALRVRKADPHGSFRVLGEALYAPPSTAAGPQDTSDLSVAELPRRDWTEHTQALWEYGTVFNYDFDSGDLARVESLRRVSAFAAGQSEAGLFFGNLGLRWGIRMKTQPPVGDYRRYGGSLVQDWDEQRPAFPDLRLATRWREETGSLAALDALHELSAGELVLETGRRARGSAPLGRIRVLEKSPNRLRLETETAEPSWLFALRGFWGHRDIRIDGRAVAAVPAYLAYSAVSVPPGRHRLDWNEQLPGGSVSRFGPVLAAVAFGALARRRRTSP